MAPMSLKRLRDLLAELGPAVTTVQLAEMLWLAQHLPAPEPPAPEPAGPPADASGPAGDPRPTDADPDAPDPPPMSSGRPPVGLHGTHPTRRDAPPGTGILAPTAPLLRRPLEIQRALRPLRLHISAQHRTVMDEEATAARIADQPPSRPWVPVLVPARERLLSLALVVDTGPTMGIWRPLAWELREALLRIGAFRDLRLWWLVDQDTRIGIRSAPDSPTIAPSALIDPAGRQVVLVLSDCSGQHWWNGTVQRTLHLLASRGPTALVQPLAERLWRRTAAAPVPGRATLARTAAPNTALCFTPHDKLPTQRPGAVPVPVLELTPSWLADWANLLTASGSGEQDTAVTFVTELGRPRTRVVFDERALSIRDRVSRFRAAATVEAVALAVHTAVSTPVLPVMRLIQQRIVPNSGPTALAEVLLCGLLYLRDPDLGIYDFVPGARAALLALLPRATSLATAEWLGRDYVRDQVSSAIESMAGSAATTFRALAGTVDGSDDAETRPTGAQFALVSPEALALLAHKTYVSAEKVPAAAAAAEPLPPGARAQRGGLMEDDPVTAPIRVRKVDVPSVPQVRVGLWGAPNSGKTTFLASLFLAADQLRAGSRTAPIAVRALDQPSEEFKRRYSLMLAAGRRFPEATASVSAPLQWQLTGDLRGVDIADRRWWNRWRHVPLDFVLRMRDIPGEAFRDALHAGPDAADSGYSSALDLVGELADCQGLVYLFDPSREAYNADSYAYFEGVLTQL